MKHANFVPQVRGLFAVTAAVALGSVVSFATAQPSQQPLFLTAATPPAVLLTMARDHKNYYEAYNDASDIDGDGVVDTRYKTAATFAYYGLFDSYKCYTYSGADGRFNPVSATTTKKCPGSWSGDFLNYITTTRIDALRRVLYGGMRSIDTGSLTVIERAYIPQDAHSFGKEYTSVAVDGYDIHDYTPYAVPASGTRHLFANTTQLVTRSRDDLSQPPLLRVVQGAGFRVWDWLSKERMVAEGTIGGKVATDMIVRVRMCAPNLLEADCKGYPDGSPTSYKPTGILHEFGEEGQMLFGLLTGSYDNNQSGGVLRRNIANFADEINSSDGTFRTDVKGIVYNLGRLRPYGFGNYGQYDCGWNVGDSLTSGQNCEDWGNPVGEMMYEGLRYFAGKKSPTTSYIKKGKSKDDYLGLTSPSWNDPFVPSNGSLAVPYCSKPVQMVVSDIYPSFDSDELPGSAFGSFAGDLSGLSVEAIANTISNKEGISSGLYFIGDSKGVPFDGTASAKNISGFGSIRGLAPDEPTRSGSYYSAAVAHFGKGLDLRKDLADDNWAQTVDTYAIALTAPLPRIQIPVGDKTITLIPFGKSMAGYGIDPDPSKYQPTNQVVDFYVDFIANQNSSQINMSINGGRPAGKFRINFEDVEQGADHDMDAIAEYSYVVNADGSVSVSVDASVYAAGSIAQHMGFIINGSTADRTYLVVRDRDTANTTWGDNAGGSTLDVSYNLDYRTPAEVAAGKIGLPLKRTITFWPGASTAQFIPHDPLWYAAKYGGYPDKKNPANKKVLETGISGTLEDGWQKISAVNGKPTSDPKNYFLVTNAATLGEQLRSAFRDIQENSGVGTAAASSSTVLTSKSRSFIASYNSEKWTGKIVASAISDLGKATQLWETSDTVSFPTAHGDRKVLTYWVNAPYEFKISATAPIPTTAYSSFQTSSIAGLMAADSTTNWAALTAAQKQTLAVTRIVNYVRGDRSREIAKGGTLKNRAELLGDIVNSNVVYATNRDYGFSTLRGQEGTSYRSWVAAKDSAGFKTIYVGANDGMLHAFNAETGVERFAFVPSSLFPKLSKYVTPGLPHEYYVDGRLTISDAYRGSGWTTVVLGSTGAGGRSVFALDVGNPSGTTANVLWEYKNADLGYPIGSPLITRTKDGTSTSGKWVAVFANGYYSNNKRAVLFVVDLFTGALLNRLTLEQASAANGLGSIGAYIDNGIVQQIFAGDLLGNLWRVDASATDPASWVASNGGLPIANVVSPSGKPQPITAQPAVSKMRSGGTQVFFGTGKLIDDADRSDTTVQSVYGVWLKENPGRTLTRSDLIRQQIQSESSNAYGTWRTVSNNAGNGSEWGWYLDFAPIGTGQPTGERILAPMGFSLGYVDFNTWAPGIADPCKPSGESWGMSLSGDQGSIESPQFDIDGSQYLDGNDKIGGRFAAGLKLESGGSVAAPAVNLTSGSSVDNRQQGTVISTGSGSGSCPAGQIATPIQGGGMRCTSPLEAGTCPRCSKMISFSPTTLPQCRPYLCAPDSWVQLQ